MTRSEAYGTPGISLNTKETTAAPSCPNSWRTFQLRSYIQRVFCLYVGGGGGGVLGFYVKYYEGTSFLLGASREFPNFLDFSLYNKHFWVRVW